MYADFGVAGLNPARAPPAGRPDLGGGALLDLGVYPVTFAHLFLGVPDEVQSWARLTPEGSEPEHRASCSAYPDGAVATLRGDSRRKPASRPASTEHRGRIEDQAYASFFVPSWSSPLVHERRGGTGQYASRGNGMGYKAKEIMRCLRAGLTGHADPAVGDDGDRAGAGH